MRRRWRPGPDLYGAGGFTLLEAVVVLLLLSLVVAGVLPLLTTGDLAYEGVRRRQEMLRNARVALDQITRELRAAQALRQVADGLLRFDVVAEDGNTPTVEYALEAGGDLTYRRSGTWDYRRRITVQAPAGQQVPAGYSVYVCFDHAALVSAGKSRADGRDVRVRFWDGTRMVELDRFLDPTTAWGAVTNRSNCPGPTAQRMVKVWFRVQQPVATADDRYFLYYGNPRAGTPPDNPDHVFLDYEDGSGLERWERRDARRGTYTPTSGGFHFQAGNGNGFRELSRALTHEDVEILWRFVSDTGTRDGRQVGVGARITDSGAGYRLTPGDGNNNNRMRFRYWPSWGAGGGLFGNAGNEPVAEDREYFARFYLVGNALRAAVWQVGSWDPGEAWDVTATDTRATSGRHYSLVNGERAPMTHYHRFVAVRIRLSVEPTSTLGPEEPGVSEAAAVLAGPFRIFQVACFRRDGSAVDCADLDAVRQVEVRLTVRDPDPDPSGPVPDVTLAARVVVRAP